MMSSSTCQNLWQGVEHKAAGLLVYPLLQFLKLSYAKASPLFTIPISLLVESSLSTQGLDTSALLPDPPLDLCQEAPLENGYLITYSWLQYVVGPYCWQGL